MLCIEILARNPADSSDIFSIHFQQTVIDQLHPGFQAAYTGQNSLRTGYESETSLTTTLYLGMKVCKSLELYLDPEVSGGSGISGAVGLAGFSNGETFRIGSPKPTLYPARIFARFVYDIGEKSDLMIDDSPNHVATMHSSEYVSLTAGKFGIADYFDNNDYSHDPRQQFLNWSFMNSGAWDYPADTRGYTCGVIAAYTNSCYTLQLGAVMVPERANGLLLDINVAKAYGLVAEYDRNFQFFTYATKIGTLFYINKARMGSYAETISTAADSMDITNSQRYSREKLGFAISASQPLSEQSGCFLRLSWNNGKTETWAFTEIDHSLALGYVCKKMFSPKINDEVGTAIVINGISSDHRSYLANGGMGFIIGDGRLRYANEIINEYYYKAALNPFLTVSADYQFVANPAYNADRGPVHIFSIRVHTEY